MQPPFTETAAVTYGASSEIGLAGHTDAIREKFTDWRFGPRAPVQPHKGAARSLEILEKFLVGRKLPQTSSDTVVKPALGLKETS